MANMQVYDIIILILVGWLTLRGAMKGMVSQLASIAAVIASFWAAIRFGPVLQPIMQSIFKTEPPWDKVLAITVAFVGASIAVMFLKNIVTKIISAIRMNKFDRLCGALFGFLKGVLIGMVITFFAVMLSEQTRDMATQSHSGKILVRLIQHTQTVLPEDVSTLIETNLEGFRQQIDLAKDTTEGLTKGRNVVEALQGAVTPLIQGFSSNADIANEPPSLPTNDAHARPFSLTMQRPATHESENTSTTTASSSAPDVKFNALPNYDHLTTQNNAVVPDSSSPTVAPNSSVSSFIVAPSAELQPMTSTSTPPQPAGTDWRTLFREMK